MDNKIIIDIYLSTVESKKQKKQAQQKQNHRYREHFDGCQMAEELVGWTKKVKGLRSSNLVVTEQPWVCKNSIENRTHTHDPWT